MEQLHNYAPSKHLPFMLSGLQRNTTGMTAHLQLFATAYNPHFTRTSTTKNLKQKVKKKPTNERLLLRLVYRRYFLLMVER